MNNETLKAELSEELLLFLQQEGYSHILSLVDDQVSNDQQVDDYFLMPLTKEEVDNNFEETEHIINPINSNEVQNMAQGVDAIRFLIEIPVELYNRYLNIN